MVAEAEARLWASVDETAAKTLAPSARDALRQLLLKSLCTLCAAPLYDRFANSVFGYDGFIRDMKSGGLAQLFDEKPVLLRLIASLTRQWLDTTGEFVVRLHTDLSRVRRDILRADPDSSAVRIQGGLSDPHRGGRTVLVVEFDDGRRVVYKPKDLRLDVAWHALIERLNLVAPLHLRAPLAVACDGYGWTEYIENTGCADRRACQEFFGRAGAWLALFHCFAGSDIHQENLIAAGDHPVPVDLETLLQAGVEEPSRLRPASQAHAAARELIANSVAAVGLLPAYGRSADRSLYAVGGIASEPTTATVLTWTDINSDAMRPTLVKEAAALAPNLPHIGGQQVGLGEHLEDFVVGFERYARFLRSQVQESGPRSLLDGFAGLTVRKVLRPTQFYSMLLGRLKDDRTMDDGASWSAQADFLARLADWDDDNDPTWPRERVERSALLELNVPLFTAAPDLRRARERLERLGDREIAWQTAVIRQTASYVAGPGFAGTDRPAPVASGSVGELAETAVAEADAAAAQIEQYSTRKGSGAAWIGLSWFPDSDVSQLTVVGHDLYNGTSGIAVFLAAHAKSTNRPESADFARAAVEYLRAELRSRRAQRVARLLGIGGASGLGSVIYALATMAHLLDDDHLLRDAHSAASLMTDDLIKSDRQLDAVAGSAGAILCLLRLYRATGERDVLQRAIACGDHLLVCDRGGPVGRRSWPGPGPSGQILNGMSHGAAGFAYALTSLAVASGREDFADAARECVEFERSNHDAELGDWTDLRGQQPHWRSQWCHGAVGIGMSRLGMARRDPAAAAAVADDVEKALAGATRGWPAHVDTLCCGSLGSVELFREAADVLGRADLREVASQRLSAILGAKASTGDFRWSGGAKRFNVGLFRGLAGVGYTCLRQIDPSLPNVLVWD
ncbi:type 2 lanthipeptide synthetase LanM family protein [Mycolicibacterium sp. Dal123E01]|uniref:type 2 lanthipeptide synthetase LanM family protein n=1 Tax=Mycolicibacterium sp. Dal123E01 TaxID=3457578 RepID=UPI00403E6344